jgi:raffinose/stachyose/melibiose transport system substrate-binding protein
MRNMRWIAVPAVLLASLGLATSVFGSPKANKSASTTITMLMSAAQGKATQNQIAGFEKANPDISVKLTLASSTASLGTLLNTQIASGNPPDVVLTSPGNGGLNGTGVLGNRLVDLSKEAWVKKLPKNLRDNMKYKGKVVAFPFSNFFFGMVYSKKLFRDNKVKVPTTMAQLIASCKVFKAKGLTPIAIAPGEANLGITQVWNFASQYVYAKQRNWNTLRAKNKVKFATSSGWKKAFEQLLKWKSSGCLSSGAAGVVGAQALSDIAGGKAAMYTYVNVILGVQRAQAPSLELGYFPIPGEKAKDNVVPFSSSTISVLSKNNVAAAKKLVAFFAAPANNSGYNKISGSLSNTQLATGKLPAGNEAAAKLVKKGKLIEPGYQPWPNVQISQYMGKAPQVLLTGQKTVSDILKGMDYLWDNPTATAPPGG